MSRDSSGKIMSSSREVDTFDANTHAVPDEKFMSEIQAYNNCALFSSEILRPVSQENRHIHWLLKYIERKELK
jgi:hypothetical protein